MMTRQTACKKRIRAIVCDLDQTLLGAEKRISPGNLAAIRAAQRAGILVSICSGRVATMMESYIKTIGICGPVITANGAVLVDAPGGEVLWGEFIERSEAIRFMDICREKNFDYSALTNKACFFSSNSIRRQRFEQYNAIAASEGLTQIPLVTIQNSNDEIEGRLEKLLVYELEPGQYQDACRLLRDFPSLQGTSSESGLLDIMSAGIDKGTGLAKFLELTSLSPEEVCVMGDYENDLPMFERAGVGVAMGNACESLKQRAEFITKNYYEDGVAYAIEHFILQER